MYLLSVRSKGKLYVDVQSGIKNSWHLCDTSLGCLFIYTLLFYLVLILVVHNV